MASGHLVARPAPPGASYGPEHQKSLGPGHETLRRKAATGRTPALSRRPSGYSLVIAPLVGARAQPRAGRPPG